MCSMLDDSRMADEPPVNHVDNHSFYAVAASRMDLALHLIRFALKRRSTVVLCSERATLFLPFCFHHLFCGSYPWFIVGLNVHAKIATTF